MVSNHMSKIPTENALAIKKCLSLAKISNLMNKFVMSVTKLNQRTIVNLVICLCFGLIMHYIEFSQICYNWADRVLRSERSLDKFGYIDMKKHDSLIELLIAENTRYNNIDDNI